MKTFRINKELTVVCRCENTRSGFRHLATLLKNGSEVDTAKACYSNRTWESFEYESVIEDLLSKSVWVSDRQRKLFLNKCEGKDHEKVNSNLGVVGAIALMGEVLQDTQKEKNDWKKRMIKAGMGEGISIPDDWNELSEDEKEKRLDKVIGFMQKGVQHG